MMAPQKKRWKLRKATTDDERNNNVNNNDNETPSKKTKSKPAPLAETSEALGVNGGKGSRKDKDGVGSWSSGHLFHGYGIHVILFLVMTTRMGLTTDKTAWWVAHPDESYQAVEVAHSEVYGYGFRSFEYFPELDAAETDTRYQLHRQIGMTGTKSWIPVRFYAFFLRAKEVFRIPISPFQMTKTAHIGVAGLLPVSTFLLVRNCETSFPNDVASLAAILVAFTDYFVLLGTHTFLESLIAPVTFLGLAFLLAKATKPKTGRQDKNFNTPQQTESRVNMRSGPIVAFCSGLLLGVSVFAKPDSIIVVVATFLCLVGRGSFNATKVVLFLSGLAVSVSLCAAEELLSYGHAGMWSPVRWWRFHYHSAHKVFGSYEPAYYFNYILKTPIIFGQVVCAMFSLVMVVLLPSTRFWDILKDCKSTLMASIAFFVAFLVTVAVHSYFELKNVKFIHDALVLLACSSAASIFVLFRFLRTILIEENQEKLVVAFKLFVYAEALMCVVRSSSGYPSAKNHLITDKTLVPEDFWESSQVSSCLDYVGRQSDVTGLVLDFSVLRMSGFTGIHQDVPLLAKTFQDFREWRPSSGRNLTDRPMMGGTRGIIRVHSFDDVTNFYAEESGLTVLKHVIENSEYNYAILTRNRKFPNVGFREAFRAGNATVFRRKKSKKAAQQLDELKTKLKPSNSSVLEYEARFLVRLGLPGLAVQRMELALRVDKKCLACFQILHSITKNSSVKQDCFKYLGPKICAQKSKSRHFHPQYSLGVYKAFNIQPILS